MEGDSSPQSKSPRAITTTQDSFGRMLSEVGGSFVTGIFFVLSD